MNNLISKKITFPDKQSKSNIGNDDTFHLTAGNINNIKNTINITIDHVVELQNRIEQNIESRLIELDMRINDLDTNPSFKVLLDQADAYLSGQIRNIYSDLSRIDLIINENINNKLPYLTTECYTNKLEIQKLQIKVNDFNQTTDDLNEINTKLENNITKVDELESLLDQSNKKIKKIEDDTILNSKCIKQNSSDLTSLKKIVNNMKDELVKDNKNANDSLNKFLIMASNILFYIHQIEERIFTQDSRADHLERLIRGLEDPPNWDDWNLLFRLLNELKLKIGKLSLVYKVPVNEVIITDENIAEFKYLLNEVEHKLKYLPYDEIVETDINVEEIFKIISNIDTIRTVDPVVLNFYPIYPVITDKDEIEDET